jgi:hypothetical protein
MSTARTISRRSGTRAAVVAIIAVSAVLLGGCGSETTTESEAPPVSESVNLNPNEHRGHSDQADTGSPNVNQREHVARRGVSEF